MSIAKFAEFLKGRSELEISVKGRLTKKTRSTTVWFVYTETRIHLLPVSGSDTNWYKNVLKDPNIDLTVDGRTISSKAKPVTEPEHVQEIIKLFAGKYGGLSEINRWYSKLDVAIEIPLA